MYRIYSTATDRYLAQHCVETDCDAYHWALDHEDPALFHDLDHAHKVNAIWGSPQSIVVEVER